MRMRSRFTYQHAMAEYRQREEERCHRTEDVPLSVTTIMAKRRYFHKPAEKGFIAVDDMARQRIETVNCWQGGAQQVFTQVCERYAREGWTLEDRKHDYRFANKDGRRIHIHICTADPNDQTTRTGAWLNNPTKPD